MKRRVLTTLLGSTALCLGAGPAASGRNDRGLRRVGWLSPNRADSDEALQGRRLVYQMMRRAGYDEGRNLLVERRYAEDDPTRLAALAEALVRLDLELIIAVANDAIAAARQASAGKVPVVMLGASFPVDLGFVASLASPGGSVTGSAWVVPETAGRMLQVLKEAAPAVVRVALLFNPRSPGVQRYGAALERAARGLQMQVDSYEVSRPQDIGSALRRIAQHRMDALCVVGDPLVNTRLADIAAFALKHKMPSIGTSQQFLESGATLYHGPELAHLVERTIHLVDRVLKGERPAELPVEPSTVFELAVNLKTASAIGVTIPRALLLRADRVLE